MINLDLLQDFLNDLDVGMPVYLNMFPEELQYTEPTDIKDAVAFSLKTIKSNPVMERTNMRLLVRAGHPMTALKTGEKFINALDHRTNVVLGNTQIILFNPTDMTPEVMGLDQNGNSIYKVDIVILASPLE